MREFKDRVALITSFSFDPDLNIRVAEITPLVRGQNRHFDPVSLTLYRIKQNRLPFLAIHPSQTKDMLTLIVSRRVNQSIAHSGLQAHDDPQCGSLPHRSGKRSQQVCHIVPRSGKSRPIG